MTPRTNTAVIPTPEMAESWRSRWEERRERAQQGGYDLVLLGDSITHAWDDMPEISLLWERVFQPRRALCHGYSGARTEHLLWMLQNGALGSLGPRGVVLLIGTNNSPPRPHGVGNTGEEIAEGIQAIVAELRRQIPEARILLLRIFPRDDIPGAREECDTASELASGLADDRTVFYLDINRIFETPDGRLDRSVMPDGLHPNADGYARWAEAIEPALTRLVDERQC